MSAPNTFIVPGRNFSRGGIEMEQSPLMREYPAVASEFDSPCNIPSATQTSSPARIIMSIGLAVAAIVFSGCAGFALITVALGAEQMFTLLQGCLNLLSMAISLILEDHFNLVCTSLLVALLVSSILFWLNRLVRNHRLSRLSHSWVHMAVLSSQCRRYSCMSIFFFIYLFSSTVHWMNYTQTCAQAMNIVAIYLALMSLTWINLFVVHSLHSKWIFLVCSYCSEIKRWCIPEGSERQGKSVLTIG